MPNDKDGLISWIIENVALTGSKGRAMDDLWSQLSTQTNYTNDIESLWALIISELEFILLAVIDETSSKTIPTSDLKNSTFEGTKSRYGASLYWTAALRDQTHYLLRDLQITLPPLQLTILERIGSSGTSGVAQCVITAEMGLKPQTIFYHLRKLQSLELIRKTPSIYHGQYTNTCVHSHYSKSVDDTEVATQTAGQVLTPVAPDGSIRYDVTAERMNQLLLQAKDNMMALSDIVRLTGFTTEKQLKWARNFLAKQHTEGFVEKCVATANGKRTVYVRLIKPISIGDGKVESPTDSNTNDDENKDSNQSLAQQTTALTGDTIAAYIASKNGNGCTNKDLYHGFPNSSKSTISTLVKKLRTADDSNIVVIKQLQGRSHVYCYFTKDGFEQYQHMKNGLGAMASATQQSDDNETREDVGNTHTVSSTYLGKKRRSISPSSPSAESTMQRNTPNTATNNATESTHFDNNLASENGNVNVTMTCRKTALLEIINRDRIRDFNVQLFDEIQAIDGSDKNHKLARRTVQRLVDGLEKQGLLRLIKIIPKGFFGGSRPRTLVLSPELDESHQLVVNYLEHKQQDATVSTNREISINSSTNNVQLLKTTDTLVKRYGCGRYTDTDTLGCSEKYWRYIAKRHGWVESKWLRSKELHLFLVNLLLQRYGGILENERQRTIPLIDMIMMMPFDVYKKTIGIHQYDEAVETYAETNQEPTVTLAEIPDDIKRRLIPNPYQMRRRIQSLLTILEKLDLVRRPSTPALRTQNGDKSLSETPTASTNITYTLQLNGAIRNYLLLDRPILAEKSLTSMDSVVDYWNELQYTCACVYGTDSDYAATSRTKKNDSDPLSTITLSRTWTNGDIITAEQKRCLDQHANYSLGQVPINDWALFLQLSRTTGLLPYRIRSYYLNLGNAFVKRNRLEQQQASAEELEHQINQQPSSSTTTTIGKRKRPLLGNSISASSPFQTSMTNHRLSQVPDNLRRHTISFSAPTFVGSRSLRRTYVKSLDESIARKDHMTGKRTIQRFTSTEKTTFLYALAIMRHREHQGNKFYWAPMTLVIPDKSIRQYKSHLHSLSVASLRKIDDLQIKWAKIYARGMKTKEIRDERPWDTKDFDLAGYLKYFLAQLLLEDESTPTTGPTILLPVNKSTVQSICTVGPVSYVKDTLDGSENTTSQTMGNTSENKPAYYEKSNDLANAIQLIKMIMIHPEESFDAHLAYSLLSCCSADSMEEAYTYLKDAGAVVLSKHGDTRRVPGRKFRMSNKFILSLAGPVSRELYDAAFDFHHHVINDQQVPKLLDDGMMMALLNLISQRKITMYNQTSDPLAESLSSTNYPNPNRFHGKFIEQWINKHINLRIQTDEVTPLTTRLTATTRRTKQLIEMISSSDAYQYLKNQPLKSIRHNKSVYSALDEFGSNGASSMELKSKLNVLKVRISDLDMMMTLQTLVSHSPSLVVRAGFDDLRWICVPHAKSWMIKMPTKVDTEQRNIYVQPNMWTHLDGTINQSMLYACGSSLLGYILTKPGITQTELEQIFYDTMSRAECQLVLDVLLEHGIIYCHSTTKQEKATLFSKQLLKSVKSTIAPSVTTYYFTTHDYYCKLDSLKRKC